MKLKLTRDEREMIHIVALITFTFTLIASAITALALGLSL
jgi:energy-converting hydrogenase Eha subunit A